jgi:GWxTD domain-containing protein
VEAILLHELAHIRRYDYLVNLLQVFVEGLLFYHPAVWWISGVMRAERENCCDDLVVGVTGGALEYASALTALETRRSPRELLAATGGGLVNRIQRLLGGPERRNGTVMPVLTAAILTVTVVTAVAALQLGSGARVTGTINERVAAAVGGIPTPPLTVEMTVEMTKAVEKTTNAVQKTVLLAQAQQAPPVAAQQTVQPDKVLFDRAISNIEHGNYLTARLTLNTLINSFPNSEYLMRAKLAIADSWRREGDAHGLAQAKIEYRDFILFYPNTAASQEAKLMLMSIDPYEKWALEDVVYIISDEERTAFNRLTTDEEREKFVEQFWLRRDPTPSTPENEFKEEHYRRIAYANNHFGIPGLAGWRTDRGRIYIQYGPPDEIEAHSAGGKYERPMAQGGGEIETFPFEQWRYRYIDGVGQNIIIEFIDPQKNGEYRMTMDPSEKDILLHPPAVAPAR